MSEDENQSSFLNRWSSRKRDAAIETEATDSELASQAAPFSIPLGGENNAVQVLDSTDYSPTAELADDVENTLAADVPEEEVLLTDADMPPIESLTAESDVSPFFNKGISAALRKAALRFVFQQPKFNVRDGLNDYDGDYTVFEPLGDTITSDMKFHAARKERDRLAAEAAREEELLKQQEAEQLEQIESEKQAEPLEEEPSAEDETLDDERDSNADTESDDEPSLQTDDDMNDDSSLQEESENGPTTLALAETNDTNHEQDAMHIAPLEQA
jgi:hypothetical protein